MRDVQHNSQITCGNEKVLDDFIVGFQVPIQCLEDYSVAGLGQGFLKGLSRCGYVLLPGGLRKLTWFTFTAKIKQHLGTIGPC